MKPYCLPLFDIMDTWMRSVPRSRAFARLKWPVPITSSLPMVSSSLQTRVTSLSLMTLNLKVSFHTGFLPPSLHVLLLKDWVPIEMIQYGSCFPNHSLSLSPWPNSSTNVSSPASRAITRLKLQHHPTQRKQNSPLG